MRIGPSNLFAILLCLLAVASAHAQKGAARSWTDSSGRTLLAVFDGVEGDQVRLIIGGLTVRYPLTKLSTADQAHIQALLARSRSWPKNVEVSSRALEIETVTEEPAARRYVYRSESFEFSSQAKLAASVMKEVARTFEATRMLLKALPWSITCQPPDNHDRFLAALYETRKDYIDAGGPESSGGVYSSGDKTFKIPFLSLGLVKRGQTYFKSDFSNDTLVHEITHQLMDECLPFLPMWVIEGTAEYTGMLPYKAGTFRADAHKSALKESIETWTRQQGFALEIHDLAGHLRMTHATWNKAASNPQAMSDLYHRSLLLVYFFCHLDEQGERFIRFMEAVQSEAAAWRRFIAHPEVKRMSDGSFRYPSNLTPPDLSPETAPFKHLPILLAERSPEQLSRTIVDAYQGLGIKISVK